MRRQQNLTPFLKKPCRPLLQVPILKRQFNLMELVRQVVVKVGFWCLPYSRAYFRKLPIQPRGQTHRIFNSLIRPKLQVGLEFLEYLLGLLVFYIVKIHILYTCFHCCSCIAKLVCISPLKQLPYTHIYNQLLIINCGFYAHISLFNT